MKFKANVKLRDAVYRHLKLDEAGNNKRKEQNPKKKQMILLSNTIPQAKRFCKLKRLVLLLVKTFYVPQSNLDPGGPHPNGS